MICCTMSKLDPNRLDCFVMKCDGPVDTGTICRCGAEPVQMTWAASLQGVLYLAGATEEWLVLPEPMILARFRSVVQHLCPKCRESCVKIAIGSDAAIAVPSDGAGGSFTTSVNNTGKTVAPGAIWRAGP